VTGRAWDYVWWFTRVRLRRGHGRRVVLTRLAGLAVWLLFIASWMLLKSPWALVSEIMAMTPHPIVDTGFVDVAKTLSQTSGTFAGFAVTILVLLFTDMGAGRNSLGLANPRAERPTDQHTESARFAMHGIRYIRDISVSMHSISFFAFTIAAIGFGIVSGRGDRLSAAVAYCLSSAAFYIALLLFFGALVPLFRLSQLKASIPVSRALFLGASLLGGIMVLQSARSPAEMGYSAGIAFTSLVAVTLLGPLWAANAFTGLRHRRRTMPSIGVWASVAIVGLTGIAILVLPSALEGRAELAVGWARATYVVAALAVTIGVSWSMLLGALDPDAQPHDYGHVVVLTETSGQLGLTHAGMVLCAFSARSDVCECGMADDVFEIADPRTIDDSVVAPYLAAYAAAYCARDYTDRSVCVVLNDRGLAEELNRVMLNEYPVGISTRTRLVLGGLARLASAFDQGVRFAGPLENCQRLDCARRLATA
jgi:hypothetical protein